MTRKIRVRFRRLLIILAVVPGAALALGLTAASASASATTPGYGHQRCDETLIYIQEGYYGGQFVEHDNVCNVEVFHQGGYGRHHQGEESVAWQTERHGYEQDHFASDVRDVEVFR